MINAINTTTATRVVNTNALTTLKADIRRYPIMSVEEEISAFNALSAAKTEEERNAIMKEIANANLRFVLSVAQKYSSDGDKVAELVSVGTIGLYRAMESFDLTRGFKFISHAVSWIRAEFAAFFRTDANMVRRSNNGIIGSKDKKIAERFFQTEFREPSEEEIIEALEDEYGIKVKYKGDVVKIRTKSINDKANGEDESTYEDTEEYNTATAVRNDYEGEMEREHLSTAVDNILSVLPIKTQSIIRKYFGIGCEEQTLESIAEEFGYTAERVRQIVVNTAKSLKGRAMKVLTA